MTRFQLTSPATLMQDVFTEFLGFQGIVISGFSAILLVIFIIAAFSTEHRTVRRFVIPLAIIYLGATADRFLTGGAYLSSATELDLTQPEKVLSAASRTLLIAGAGWLAWSTYTAYRDRERRTPHE